VVVVLLQELSEPRLTTRSVRTAAIVVLGGHGTGVFLSVGRCVNTNAWPFSGRVEIRRLEDRGVGGYGAGAGGVVPAGPLQRRQRRGQLEEAPPAMRPDVPA
jgi:hypothetical protein